MRASVTVRNGVPDDLPAVLELYDELCAAGPRGTVPAPTEAGSARAAVAARYARAIESPDERLAVVVTTQGEVVGMSLMTRATSSGLVEALAVHMNHVSVAAGHRRRGAGRALVAAATAWAEEIGAAGVAVPVYPSGREANRFFARLGFAPVSVTRVASVPALRRRLGSEVPSATLDEGHLMRRRRLRAATRGRAPTSRPHH